jgi:hypothetical protein
MYGRRYGVLAMLAEKLKWLGLSFVAMYPELAFIANAYFSISNVHPPRPRPLGVTSLRPVDAIYVTASSKDGRFTRICVASIRHFYPEAPILLLAGGALEPGLENELETYWNVHIAALDRGDWGWGFIKLEPLFGKTGERFLILDSDTVITGPVLDIWDAEDAQFVVDDEQQSEADTHRLYYDWKEVGVFDTAAVPPLFVFNSGQWFGTAGIFSRKDFASFLDWSGRPPRHRRPGLFKNGDQGLFNYVLNQKFASGRVNVAQRKIMLWPGHGMGGMTARTIADGTAPARIVHWAGMKASRLGAMVGSDILVHFERAYYDRLPSGDAKRVWRQVAYPAAALREATARRVQGLVRRLGRLIGASK